MLTPEENHLLTRVEGDAPMGQMMRRNYWIPCARAAIRCRSRCSGDMAIVRMRRALLQAAEDFIAGRRPLGIDPDIGYANLHATAGVIPSLADCKEPFAAA